MPKTGRFMPSTSMAAQEFNHTASFGPLDERRRMVKVIRGYLETGCPDQEEIIRRLLCSPWSLNVRKAVPDIFAHELKDAKHAADGAGDPG